MCPRFSRPLAGMNVGIFWDTVPPENAMGLVSEG